MEAVKEADFVVFREKDKEIVYSGGNPFKAQQLLHGKKGVNIQFKGQIQAAIFSYVLLNSERLN